MIWLISLEVYVSFYTINKECKEFEISKPTEKKEKLYSWEDLWVDGATLSPKSVEDEASRPLFKKKQLKLSLMS